MSLALAALLMYGCSDKPEESSNTTAAPAEVATPVVNEDAIEENLYGTTTKQVATQAATPQEQAAEVTTIPHTGTVLETMDAAGYTYAKIKEGDNVYWIAGPKTTVAVGDAISFTEQMVMKDFTSKTLNKTFDYLVFANTIVPADAHTAAAAHKAAALPASKEAHNCDDCGSKDSNSSQKKPQATQQAVSPHGDMTAAATAEIIKIEKLPNGFTIEELYTQKSDLNGTVVSFNAKVIKVSKNIMGKDWVHLQDGSTANDITATGLNTTVNVGDTVTAKGTLKTDVDFGYGYFFPVIMEESTFTVK